MVIKSHPRISIDSQICHGKPCITGTRIMVVNILSLIAGGYDKNRILEYYPELKEEDITAAVEYAISELQNEDIYLAEVSRT